MIKDFLPINKKYMKEKGWEQVDFVLVTGDAYVDHPSFGAAVIGRVLESYGYKVAILPQPKWNNCEDFKEFGRPRLGFLITSGNVDSMVNNYSVWKNKRKIDDYSPGGKRGKRPDRSLIVYANRAREAYKEIPVIIGGIEASLRRFSHYDYWEDKIRKSILLDSKADILVYGMGEKAIIEIAEALDSGIKASDIGWIKGTSVKIKKENILDEYIKLPRFTEVIKDKDEYAKSFLIQQENNDHITAKAIYEEYEGNTIVLQNIPQIPIESDELDKVYDLLFTKEYHPDYENLGGVPALNEVKFSITSNRGCFGNCSFCAIAYHQGRQVRARSKGSILKEAKALTNKKDFKGYIHDIGGPTANFFGPACAKQLEEGVCKKRNCLYPFPCENLDVDHSKYLEVLREVRELPNIKRVFIKSGIRYDYLLADKEKDKNIFLKELCKHHVSGTLKVAPEHVAKRTIKAMRKAPKEIFEKFSDDYYNMNKKLDKKQYLIPYLMSSHPGTRLEDALELGLFLKDYGFVPDQVQDFYPTPSTLATTMYYTEKDPNTGENLCVAKNINDKKIQKALIHFNKRENEKYLMMAYYKTKDERIKKLLRGKHVR